MPREITSISRPLQEHYGSSSIMICVANQEGTGTTSIINFSPRLYHDRMGMMAHPWTKEALVYIQLAPHAGNTRISHGYIINSLNLLTNNKIVDKDLITFFNARKITTDKVVGIPGYGTVWYHDVYCKYVGSLFCG